MVQLILSQASHSDVQGHASQCLHLPGCVDVGLEGDMALYDPQKGRRKIYKYDKVFGVDSTQVEVYEDTKALIRSVLDGVLPFNACPPSL